METWKWQEDWDELEEGFNDWRPPKKYMDIALVDDRGEMIIPLRVDHYQLEYDGDLISKRNRNLIASAPELLEICMEFIGKVESGRARSSDTYNKMKKVVQSVIGE